VTTYGTIAVAIYIFQTYLININWRYTQYGSTFLASALGLLWILAFYDVGGTRNAWFTIFIDLDQVREFTLFSYQIILFSFFF
jgi:hypothetical protein